MPVLSDILDYILELGAVLFIFCLLANSEILLFDYFRYRIKENKPKHDLSKLLLISAYRSFIATTFILILSFIIKALALFLRYLYEFLKEFCERVFKSSSKVIEDTKCS